MDVRDLFSNCRRGDISKIRDLVEVREVEVNLRDKWDSTPLYYACLCGHVDVVKYLLENGAKCEVNTFDGERCLYGALNDEIRNLLRHFKVVSSNSIKRDAYEDFLRRLLEEGHHSDVEFSVHGHRFPAHRCILAARSSYFAEMLMTKWVGRHIIQLSHEMIFPKAFHAVLTYIYTGRMAIGVNYVEDCMRLAKQCYMKELIDQLTEKQQQSIGLQRHKPGMQVTTICVDSDDNLDLQQHLGQLADLAIPPELCTFIVGELPFQPECQPLYPDICFCVSGHYFDCHKAFFCVRSDYFKALLLDHFGENSQLNNLPVITLHDLTPQVFVQILRYIYQDSCQLTLDLAYDVLLQADLYLLVGLKRQCGNVLATYLDHDNAVHLLKTARLFSLPKLQDSCYRFIANNIEHLVDQEEFSDLVLQDAHQVNRRQETDTIDVIDEVRYHITNYIETVTEMLDAKERLGIIDRLLEKLDLEG